MTTDEDGLTITVTPGTVLHTKKSLGSEFSGELTVDSLSHEGELVWSIYKPLDEPNHSGTRVMHKVKDMIYFVKSGYWKVVESPTTPLGQNLDQGQIEDLLEEECFDELDDAVKHIHKEIIPYWDEAQVLAIVMSRVKLVWDRANAHAGITSSE